MSEVPAGGTCPDHPTAAATAVCPRCGRFICPQCERRKRPDALPLCPACWELRGKRVKSAEPASQKIFTAGLVLGALSILPFVPLWIGSFALNVVALVQSRKPEARAQRWKPIVGLALTVVLGGVWGAIIARE